ncbi:MAG: tetratricopeptide repeat protein [Gemmatimonadetes bacterium]|nr:tetratricopeptide repeat protein [Gemmatimonadota bacterium]
MAYQSEIEKLERRYSDNPEQYFAPLADAHRKAGNVDLALEVVRAGLAKRPNYTSAHIVLGRCLLDQKKDAEAAKAFEHVLQLDAENIIALRILGEIGERSHDVPGALSWFKRLLEVDPMSDDAQEAIKRLETASAAPPPAPSETAPAPAAESAGAVAGFETTAIETAAPGAAGTSELAIERSDGSVDVGAATTAEMEPIQLEQPGGALEATPAGLQLEEPGVVQLEPAATAPPSVGAPMARAEPRPSAPELLSLEEALVLPEEPMPAAEAPARASASWKKEDLPQDLPLILPEEGAPVPAPAMTAAPPAGAGPSEAIEPEPVITETMAEVYMRQGLVQEARDVYRKLVRQRPGDVALRARLDALEQRGTPARGVTAPAVALPAAPPRGRFAVTETGGVPARSFLSTLLAARPGSGAGTAAEAPMAAAFADESVPAAGAPTAPAANELSLASVFGEEAVPAPAAKPEGRPAVSTGGFSFDEFFGGKPPQEAKPAAAAEPQAAEGEAGASDDFVSWLKGLKS